jgi:competence CoiA-like predicted nuclease
MVIDGKYFCPACGKNVTIVNSTTIKETSFSNSRVIPLDKIFLLGTKDDLKKIRMEVYNNFDFYYNEEKDTSELSKKMESVMKDKAYDYNKEYSLIKNKKRR